MLENITKAIFFMEDFSAFKSVQLNKYSKEKNGRVKPNTPEWDMIIDLIKDYWCELLATGYLNNKDTKEKEYIFFSIEIIFPYIEIPITWLDGIDYVDFASYHNN